MFIRFLILARLISSLLAAAPSDLTTGFLPQREPGGFWAVASSYSATFDAEGIHLFRGSHRAHIRFPGARLSWRAEGESTAAVHFFGPRPASVSGSSTLRAPAAFPGVDIVIRARGGQLKTEFHLAPGVSPSVPRYCLIGATARPGPGGRTLEIDAGDGWAWTEENLESWQTGPAGRRLPVPSRFRAASGCVTFDLPHHDPALPLVIDPDLTFSSYLGGGLFDNVTAVATDSQGNLYLGGWTESSDFPALAAYQSASGGRIDVFVAKVNASGQLVFSTFLGGSGEDRVQAIAVSSTGQIVVAGLTSSSNFPVVNAARPSLAGGRDAFVTRLTAAGNQLVFSTYLGGAAHDAALALAIDSSGNAVVAGETASTNFPAVSAYSATAAGGVDGFLARLSSTGTLNSSTYLGGLGDDRVQGLALASDNSIHLTGATASSNFPVSGAPYPSLRGSMDAFYTRFNSTASALTYSTYLGGTAGSSLAVEAGYGIAIDSTGRAWIAGVTPSSDFPGASSGNQSSYGGGLSDAFVSVFTAAGAVEWSTYIGGAGVDSANAVSVGAGFVGVAGHSNSADLPVTGALQSTRAGEYDAFWAVFPAASTAPLYISYFGGSGSDSALAATASGGSLVIAGSTLSSNLPLVSPIQSANPGSYGGFVSRLRFGPGPITITPAAGAGLTQTFTLRASHVNGAAALQDVAFLANSSYSFSLGCYIYYSRSANLLWLYRDETDTWLSLTPGAATTISNNRCTLAGAGASAAYSGNTATIVLPLTFAPAFSGAKLLYGNATDTASLGAGWPQVGSWTIASSATPTVTSVTPSSGTGLSQTFTVNVSDANGAADIATASFLLNSTLSTANGCWIEWRRSTGQLHLFRDSDSAWLPLTPGSGVSVENTNCFLSGSAAAVTANGSQLTLTLPLVFRTSFSGSRTLYAAASDIGSLASGWQTAGSWTPVGQLSPTVTSVTPNSGSGGSQTFTVIGADPNTYLDIASVELLFNTTLSVANGCYLRYSRAGNTISLYRDSTSSWISVAVGSSSSVSNANCTVYGTGVTVAASGDSIVLSVLVLFQPPFAGSRNIYAGIADTGGLSSGWTAAGAWNVTPAVAPTVTSLTPSSATAATHTFTAVLSDGNGNADINSASFLVSPILNGANGCYITYNRSLNLFYLFKDADASWQSISPGAATTVANTNCTLAGAGLSATASGNSLTLTLPITLDSSVTGSKNIYLIANDAGGLNSGWQTVGTWIPPGSAAPPQVVSVNPNSGSGTQQNFTLVLSDPNGHGDIASAVILINNVLSGSNACYISFNRAISTFYLRRDSDASWQPIAVGSTSSVTNDNCTLSGTGLAVTGSGTNLTLVLPLTFKPAFTGQRNFYATTADAGGLSSGWQTIGTWTPSGTPAAPTVASLSPNAGGGATQTFTVVLSDANGQADITSAVFVINSVLSGSNGCYFFFNRSANSFYLFRDSDSAWLPITPGASSSVANANCTLSGATLAATGSGNNLTLTLPLSFQAAFAGGKTFYASVTDAGGLSSGWQTAGTWNPSGAAATPAFVSLSPNSGSSSTPTFSLVISDENGAADVSSLVFLINSSLNGSNGCYITWTRNTSSFYLFRDSDSAWLPLSPGASASVSNDNCTLAGSTLSVSPSGANLTFTLPITFKPAFSGSRTIYVSAGDSGGLSTGWRTAGSWTPFGTPLAPSVTSWSPNSGSGASQTFTAAFTDGNGFGDIAGVTFVINAGLNGSNACYLSYNRAANTFYLFRDSDGAWQPITPGAATSVTNNNCTLSGAALAASGSGNVLTLTMPIAFKAAFAGARNVYATVSDGGGLSSGWITAGSWTVP